MSTKNISRTVIEGGRTGWSKNSRRQSNADARAMDRNYAHDAKTLIDPDSLKAPVKRYKVSKDFADKTRPIYRWLDSNIGKSWAKVKSEIHSRFDTRTTAGRHIVYDHVLSQVDELPDVRYPNRYYVDTQGCLQENAKWKRKRDRLIPNKIIEKWVNDRKILKLSETVLFWMYQTSPEWQECGNRLAYPGSARGYYWSGLCSRNHRDNTKLVAVPEQAVFGYEKATLHREVKDGVVVYYRPTPIKECQGKHGSYRQGKRLDVDDMKMWSKLSEGWQTKLDYDYKTWSGKIKRPKRR